MKTEKKKVSVSKVMKEVIDNLEKVVKTSKKSKGKSEEQTDEVFLIPTGSTLLNLECSGSIKGAFQCGKMINIIGDSSSGKSLLALSTLAECAITPNFEDYHFIYDDVEAANEFNISSLFGKQIAARIELTNRSRTIEEFNDTIARLLEIGEPFIYVLDSFDALTSEAFQAKDNDNRNKREKGGQISGSYGDGKAKIFSDFCKNRIQDLKDTRSALIIISQTRDNIGFGAMFTPKTRAGGRALRFYACHEVWLSCKKQTKTKNRITLTDVCAKISKNKLNGNRGEAYFPILRDYGIDDISSCIDFLLSEGDWKGPLNNINTNGFIEDTMGKAKLITYIEAQNKEVEVQKLCQESYIKVLANLKPNRKYKY